jgi:hypothetical protein
MRRGRLKGAFMRHVSRRTAYKELEGVERENLKRVGMLGKS